MNDTKNALVTGANKGIGREVVRQLAKQGYAVWLGARDPRRGEKAAAELAAEGLAVRPLVLDVTSDASVAAAVKAFGDGPLHALVNNAGITTRGPDTTLSVTVDEMRTVYETNVFGPVRVTQAFLPALRKSKAGRVVMVSSSLGSIGELLDTTSGTYGVDLLAYDSSKSALNSITVHFAKALLAEGIKVNAANPGYTATDLNGHQGYRSVEAGASVIVQLATLHPMGPTAGFFHDGHVSQLGRHAW